MRMPRSTVLVLLLAWPLAQAFAAGGGHFRKGEVSLDAKYAIAVLRDEAADPANAETNVYLSDVPLDAARLASAYSQTVEAEMELGEGSAGYVRICIRADGDECGLYFSHNKPNASFNLSGSGDFALDANDGKRIAGHWTQARPEDFFGETYDFDLRFDVPVAAPQGKPLPDDGGEPGRAYRAWIAAVALGDVASLRKLADDDNAWRYAADDPAQAKEAIKDARDGTPLQAEILRGRSDGDRAVLWIEGKDRDDILRRGRVRMRREGDAWHFAEADLESIEE